MGVTNKRQKEAKDGKPFIIRRNNELVGNTASDYKPLYENYETSYIAVKEKNKIVIYETFRKNKNIVKRRSYKNMSTDEAIEEFKLESRDYKIRQRYGERNPYKITYKTYMNYRPTMRDINKSTDEVQLQVVASVKNRITRQSGIYVGYSQSFMFNRTHKLTFVNYDEMWQQAINHAIANRIRDESTTGELPDGQYKEIIKNSDERYEAVVVDSHYIVYDSTVRRTKAVREIGYRKNQ